MEAPMAAKTNFERWQNTVEAKGGGDCPAVGVALVGQLQGGRSK
jgi:hypothetical protein